METVIKASHFNEDGDLIAAVKTDIPALIYLQVVDLDSGGDGDGYGSGYGSGDGDGDGDGYGYGYGYGYGNV